MTKIYIADPYQSYLRGYATKPKKMIYLAAPYRNVLDKEKHMHVVKEATAYLISQGICVFSPVLYSHTIQTSDNFSMPMNESPHSFWLSFDYPFLQACSAVVILNVPGVEASRGIWFERGVVQESCKPMLLWHPYDGRIEHLPRL